MHSSYALTTAHSTQAGQAGGAKLFHADLNLEQLGLTDRLSLRTPTSSLLSAEGALYCDHLKSQRTGAARPEGASVTQQLLLHARIKSCSRCQIQSPGHKQWVSL